MNAHVNMSHGEFEQWFFSDFIKRNGGVYPKNIKRWLSTLDERHERIRKVLGGDRVDMSISAQAVKMAASGPEYEEIVDELVSLFPSYLQDNQLDRNAFASPTIPRGSHNAIKISKHFMSYAGRRLEEFPAAVAKQTIERANKCFSKLGAVWGKSSNNEVCASVTISTTPRAFALLGHYGPDQESCFRQGSDKTLDKYVVGQTPETFVATISMPSEKAPSKHRNVARAIGFLSPRSDYIFNTFNYYFTPGLAEGDAIALLTKAFGQLVGREKCVFLERYLAIEQGVFVNDYARWTFNFSDGPTDAQELSPDQNGVKIFVCPVCNRKHKTDDYWAKIDGYFVCELCASKSNVCEVSERRTFRSLIEIVDIRGNFVMVHPDIASEMPACSVCEHRFQPHGQENTIPGLQRVCASCFDDEACVCEDCGRVTGCDYSDDDTWHRVLCDDCKEAKE
jgi:hypothetical protein